MQAQKKGYYVYGPKKPETIEKKKNLQINTYNMRGELTDGSKYLFLKPPIWKGKKLISENTEQQYVDEKGNEMVKVIGFISIWLFKWKTELMSCMPSILTLMSSSCLKIAVAMTFRGKMEKTERIWQEILDERKA